MSEPTEDYTVELDEIKEHFDVIGKCVGCEHTHQGYCRKHSQWSHKINDCGIGVVPKRDKILKHVVKAAHNAKPVMCSDGRRFESIGQAAKETKINLQKLRRALKSGEVVGKLTFDYVLQERSGQGK